MSMNLTLLITWQAVSVVLRTVNRTQFPTVIRTDTLSGNMFL